MPLTRTFAVPLLFNWRREPLNKPFASSVPLFTVTFDETTEVFDRVVVPLFSVNVLRRFPDTPSVPFEIVASLTLPAIVAVPDSPLIVRVLLNLPPLSTVRRPLPLTRAAPVTLPRVWIVATELSFNVRLLPSSPLDTRFPSALSVTDPPTRPVTFS